jgi:CRP/FNR family transcriptional regulator
MSPIDFLGQLDARTREALLGLARRKVLKKGAYVFRVGDEGDSVFLLLRGRAKTYRISPEGREVILWFCFPGELFGLAAHPHQKGRMVTTQACEESEVAELPNTRFQAFLDGHPRVSRVCLQAAMFRLGILANRLVRLAADDAAVRIARLLLDLATRYDDPASADGALPLAITHQEIADITGVQRQTVTRIVGDLTARGALAARYRRIMILDRALLGQYAAQHHAPGPAELSSSSATSASGAARRRA